MSDRTSILQGAEFSGFSTTALGVGCTFGFLMSRLSADGCSNSAKGFMAFNLGVLGLELQVSLGVVLEMQRLRTNPVPHKRHMRDARNRTCWPKMRIVSVAVSSMDALLKYKSLGMTGTVRSACARLDQPGGLLKTVPYSQNVQGLPYRTL